MYSMKEVCKMLDMSYETLKYYCNEDLIPNVTRDKNNYRIFDGGQLELIKGIQCLRKCGMSIKDMKVYIEYCKEGESSIFPRQVMLAKLREELLVKQQEIQDSIDYIDHKQTFYQDVLDGKIPYFTNIKQ